MDMSEAVIIGHGNVAIDCARILIRPANRLANTDVPEYALSALRRSAVSTVKIFGRRGPVEVGCHGRNTWGYRVAYHIFRHLLP